MINMNFTCRSNKANKQGLSPIEVIITIDGKRTYCQLEMKADASTFKRMAMKKNSEVFNFINIKRIELNKVINALLIEGTPITPIAIKERLKYKAKVYTLIDIMNEYTNNVLRVKNKNGELNDATYKRYRYVFDCFLKYVDRTTPINTITSQMISAYTDNVLKSKYDISTVANHQLKLKTFFVYCFNNNYISTNIFANIKINRTMKDVECLTINEVNRLENTVYNNDRLNQVRDCFLFACYTGLSYVDMFNLNVDDILQCNGVNYIKKKRQKTEITYTTMLNDKAIEILNRYNGKLPLLSNQKYNQYLKVIAEIANIDKPLHSHIARHTFAVITLNKGYSLDITAKMMGHASTRITTHYAKLLDSTIIDEFKRLG